MKDFVTVDRLEALERLSDEEYADFMDRTRQRYVELREANRKLRQS